jgi:hypothetical protein
MLRSKDDNHQYQWQNYLARVCVLDRTLILDSRFAAENLWFTPVSHFHQPCPSLTVVPSIGGSSGRGLTSNAIAGPCFDHLTSIFIE